MREPLIDNVDKRQICTDHCALKVIANNDFYFTKTNSSSIFCVLLDIRFKNNDGGRYQY